MKKKCVSVLMYCVVTALYSLKSGSEW